MRLSDSDLESLLFTGTTFVFPRSDEIVAEIWLPVTATRQIIGCSIMAGAPMTVGNRILSQEDWRTTVRDGSTSKYPRQLKLCRGLGTLCER